MKDAQKEMVRINNACKLGCKPDHKFGPVREEVDVGKMHVCDNDHCSIVMNEWRNQWLLRGRRLG